MRTACLPNRTLEEIAEWAAGSGFEALEVAAWPDLADRPFTATHLKVEDFTEADAERDPGTVRPARADAVGAAYYDDNLHPD